MNKPDRTESLAVRHALLIFFAVVFLSFIPSSVRAATYDDFNDGNLDNSKWESDESSNTTVEESNGRLELSIFPAASGFFGAEVESKISFSGEFDLQVDFLLDSWPNQNGVRTALGIFYHNDVLVHIERTGSDPNIFQEQYVMKGKLNGGAQIDFGGNTLTSDENGKLRLQRVGDTVTGYFFDNTGNWQAIYSYTNEDLGIESSDPLYFFLSVWSGDDYFNPGDQIVTVAFDNMSMKTVPIPGAVWLLGSGFLGLVGLKRKF